jgi:hypothetical protein
MHPIPDVITCVDCGGPAHLLTTFPPDDPPAAGDLVAYRCAHCNDRWDLELSADDLEEGRGSRW